MNDKPKRHDIAIRVWLARGIIIASYAAIMFTFLYLPVFFDYFQESKSLNVCSFTETFCSEAIERFYKKTGIKVNLTYVELDEQIFAKFKINGGSGYDILNVSDFMVHKLAQMDALQELDSARIPNIERLNKRLLKKNFDPDNTFSVPHKWFMYGILYDKAFFRCEPDEMSLSYIFKSPALLATEKSLSDAYKLCMIDSPLDAFFFASMYLFGRYEDLTDDQYAQINKLMVDQKKWIECYTLYTVEYFMIKGIVPIALTSSNFVRKIWEWTDRFDFAIPQEGGMLVVENLVIPQKSRNVGYAHQFIDFMLSDEIALLNSSTYGWASSNIYANDVVDGEQNKKSHLFPDIDVFNRLHIPLYSAGMRAKVDEIWLEVGFA